MQRLTPEGFELKRRSENTIGVLDLIDGAKAGGTFPWHEAVIDVPLGERSLSLIAAGRWDELYGARLQGLQWDRLYKEMDIGQAFEDMRDDWKRSYHYVLLDSRTGVTDIGDVCTALFPDLLVTVFVANEQNIWTRSFGKTWEFDESSSADNPFHPVR